MSTVHGPERGAWRGRVIDPCAVPDGLLGETNRLSTTSVSSHASYAYFSATLTIDSVMPGCDAASSGQEH